MNSHRVLTVATIIVFASMAGNVRSQHTRGMTGGIRGVGGISPNFRTSSFANVSAFPSSFGCAVTRSYSPPPVSTQAVTMSTTVPRNTVTTSLTQNRGAITTRRPRLISLANTTLVPIDGSTVVTSPYANILGPRSPRNGALFSKSTNKRIWTENASRNFWQNRSDMSGIPISRRTGELDHITPKSKGGSNSTGNAQLLTTAENRNKAAKMPDTTNTIMNLLTRRQ